MAEQDLVDRVAAAIRYKESTNNYSLGVNADGCWGAYQFSDDRWYSVCTSYGLDPSDTSPTNQDRAAECEINRLLDESGNDIRHVAHSWAGLGASDNASMGGGLSETVGEYKEKIYILATNGIEEGSKMIGMGAANGASSPNSSGKHNNSDPIGILKFAGFAASLAFQEALKTGFESSVEQTLHEFLSTFMQRFYHNIYYIPTLPSNKCMVVKPELLFVDPPSCNVIYPCLRNSGGFSRTPRSEPTRVLMISDPVAKLFGNKNGSELYNILTIGYIDYDDDTQTNMTVKGFKQLSGDTKDISKPIGIVSEYEKKNGIRIMRTNKGSDIYLFLLSEENSSTDAKTKTKGQVITNEKSKEAIADVLFKLASYTLLRARYECRPGSYNMYFNPYIVPGFPVINLETPSESSLNVHAYCTDVVHQIDERGWSTIVSTSATHVFPDPKPTNFPIIEEEYATQLDDTYDKMLGAAVTRIPYENAIHDLAAGYSNTTETATEAYKKVWRPLTTMAEHLEVVCDGATAEVDDNGILMFKGSFFDSTVQEKIRQYTVDVIASRALSEDDVR